MSIVRLRRGKLIAFLVGFTLHVALVAVATAQDQPPSQDVTTPAVQIEETPVIQVVATPLPLPTPEPIDIDNPMIHIVSVGETLASLGARSGFAVTDLAQRNKLTQPYVLIAGQRLELPAPMSPRVRLHRVAAGDTLAGLAAKYGVSPYLLRRMNTLSCADCVVVGQLLRIPLPAGSEGAATNLPEPFESVQVEPRLPRQGDIVVVRVRANGPLQSLVGSLAGRPLRFVPQADGYVALSGVGGLQEPGVYSITLRAIAESGAASELSGRIQTAAAGFGFENLTISQKLISLLDPQVNIDERVELDGILSQWSSTQWWEGPLRLPATGRIASYFGARRSFNGGMLRTYHSGADIVAPAGTPVYASAPGRVTAVQEFKVRGLVIVIDHGRGVFTSYCHLSQADVKVGQIVNAGEMIGRSGNTGRSEGPHLHWELAVGGVTVDPLPWTSRPIP
ncbi:MAG: peptidoglycan DD-metalloendopeptidase family protein [Anaerolineae bacterium]|nr:peptidoglycan DD-metalloendopeptidase family protein [Thermoflexales bacterium]MDW8407087.1 peptidoglycan DD-metalloendopeptidase family protein [Anaerolineae bacterium]